MASSVQAYSITINNGNSNSDPADGFVDNKRIEDYGLDLGGTPGGLSYDLCKAKRRANIRYRDIIHQLQLVANLYVPPETITSDATAIAEASSFAFQVYAEHGDASLITADELNAGEFLTSTDCLVRCVARALLADSFQQIDVVDPTSDDSVGILGASTSVPRYWVRIDTAANFEIGSYEGDLATAEGFVTVVAI